MKEECKKLIQNIIYLIMGLQILMGFLWMAANLGKVPRFQECMEFLHMSETLCVDEYTGILYPLGIRLLYAVAGLLQLPGCSFVYLLQVVAAYLAYIYFLRKVFFPGEELSVLLRNRLRFGVLFILTVPPIAQCHMALLPYSLATSVMVVLLADTIELWRGAELEKKLVLRMGAGWILSAFLCPDYAWLCGVAVVLSTIRYMILRKKKAVKLLVMCLCCSLFIGCVSPVVQTEGSMGKIQKSVGAMLLQRFVWPNFSTFHLFWYDEIKALWDSKEIVTIAQHPEMVIYEFGPMVEATYGKERADDFYWHMSKKALSLDTRNIVGNIMEDTVAYLCPPLTMFLQLHGMDVGEAYTGWNYGRMKDYAPVLTGNYVNYSLSAWCILLVLCALLGILSEREKKATDKSNKKQWIGLYLGTVSIAVNLWYVMTSGNMQDYKKVMLNSILWAFLYAWMACKSSETFSKT